MPPLRPVLPPSPETEGCNMFDANIDLSTPAGWLPLVFAVIMALALAMLAYVILDGYDLGVGILLRQANDVAQKDSMIASIGPFWDANETWLVLGVGVLLLLPIPAMTLVLFGVIARSLKRLPVRLADGNQYGSAVPFACTVGIFLLSFYGLGYSLFPWLVIERITIWQAASAPEALMVIFYGVAVVLPVIIGYTVFAYRVFWGKSGKLTY